MSGTFRAMRRRSWRDWLGALALLGLLTRALLPVGFMPVSLHGQMQLVLCTPQNAEIAHPHQAPRGGSASVPCLFAAGGSALAPQPCLGPPAAILLTLTNVPSPHCSVPAAPPLRHAAARGPPINA